MICVWCSKEGCEAKAIPYPASRVGGNGEIRYVRLHDTCLPAFMAWLRKGH